MASKAETPFFQRRRDWKGAFTALGRLMANGDDTVEVFRIMTALNAGTAMKNYNRLISTAEGGRLAYDRLELTKRLSDRTFIDSFEPGTVGGAYREFVDRTGYSAIGLADISNVVATVHDLRHPYAWFGRRERDIHDVWHILTGYRADEHLGEASLVAFSYAQTGGLGWAAIALGAAFKGLFHRGGTAVVAAIWEGYRNGRRAAWLHGEDYEKLFAEPVEEARRRLRIAEPKKYRIARTRANALFLAPKPEALA